MKKITGELVQARNRVEVFERQLLEAKRRRDDLVVELRGIPDPPSARAVADLAGISNPWVLKLERGAR